MTKSNLPELELELEQELKQKQELEHEKELETGDTSAQKAPSGADAEKVASKQMQDNARKSAKGRIQRSSWSSKALFSQARPSPLPPYFKKSAIARAGSGPSVI